MYNSPHSAVVLFSGGQDSTTALIHAKHLFKTCYALSFDYQQRHREELVVSESIAQKLQVPHHVIDLSVVNQLASSSLTRANEPVLPKPKLGLPNSFVPGRNAFFLLAAAIFAFERKINRLVLGVGEVDFSGYPDCRYLFIESMARSISLALDQPFEIITPFMFLDKSEIWAVADGYGHFEMVKNETLTCYNGVLAKGCGQCPACELRSQGLARYRKYPESVQTALVKKFNFYGDPVFSKSEN